MPQPPRPEPLPEVAPGIVSYPLRRYLLDESRGKRRTYKPHWYSVLFDTIDTLNINATLVRTVTTDTDAPFLWLSTLGRSNEGTDAIKNGSILVRIGGSGGKSFAQSPVTLGNCTGKRPQGCPLPAPWLVAAGAEFHVTYTANRAFTASRQVVMFEGLKIYGWGPR